MDLKALITFAEEIIAGEIPEEERLRELMDIPGRDAFSLFPGADMIRNFYFNRDIHLCMICNGKSGRCPEDCRFCSQSISSRTEAPIYPLLGKDRLQEGGLYAYDTPINRYSIVTTGKRLPKIEVKAVADAMAELDQEKIGKCASLGILDYNDFEILKNAGISRYHHNLESSRSFFPSVCTTHSYEERLNTILDAQKAGLSVCSGGIFGMGETDEQILELAFALRALNVDSVSLNFLVPIQGTPLEYTHKIAPLRCLKIIAVFRYILPDRDIIICGGREHNLGDLHPLLFHAGASGIMTGDYLTTEGRSLEKDLEMIEKLGFSVRKG
ncbi:MAG: biotin synthase BioB [Deltaproteobacteria bacterium]|nr:biotin synthase BioB [Deltaproteobacteria bacterium]